MHLGRLEVFCLTARQASGQADGLTGTRYSDDPYSRPLWLAVAVRNGRNVPWMPFSPVARRERSTDGRKASLGHACAIGSHWTSHETNSSSTVSEVAFRRCQTSKMNAALASAHPGSLRHARADEPRCLLFENWAGPEQAMSRVRRFSVCDHVST